MSLSVITSTITITPADASMEYPWSCGTEDLPPYPGKDKIKNDPVVKLFLEKNPEISLSDTTGWSNSAGAYPQHMILKENENSYPILHLNLDHCFDVAWYYYFPSAQEDDMVVGHYWNHEKVITAITGEERICEKNMDKEYLDSYHGREQLESDLLFRGFIQTNSAMQLTEPYLTINHKPKINGISPDYNFYAPYMWEISNQVDTGYPYLRVELDRCFNVAYFGYAHSYDGLHGVEGSYDDNYHTVLTAITGKPFTPYVQVAFYEIPLREVQCNNEENKLYIKDNSKPMCLKPQTYENLLQRGYNLETIHKM